jgi:pantoate--beta-alanine ligase
MEGAVRPGHFEGVALVCAKLFNVVGPCAAYFGEKDAQQLRVVRRMVSDLLAPVDIIECPTLRDGDGLALSSRNTYLDPAERKRALALPRALRAVAERVAAGDRDVGVLVETGRAVLAEAGVDGIDYLEVVDPHTLESVERLDGSAIVCGAVRLGKTRLIDNVMVSSEEKGE